MLKGIGLVYTVKTGGEHRDMQDALVEKTERGNYCVNHPVSDDKIIVVHPSVFFDTIKNAEKVLDLKLFI